MSTNMNINTNIYNNKLCFFDLENNRTCYIRRINCSNLEHVIYLDNRLFLKNIVIQVIKKSKSKIQKIHGITKDILITK